MLDEENNMQIKPIVFVVIGIVLFMFIYIIFSGRTDLKIAKDGTPTVLNVESLFSDIKDNYSIKIVETNDDNTTIWGFDREKDLMLYDLNIDTDDEKGYIVYNNKVFVFDDEHNIYPSNDDVTSKDSFINLKLLRDTLKECKFIYISDNSSKCSIDTSKYIDNYNKYYQTDFESDDSKTDITIVYYSEGIHDINIDYTNINKIINEKDGKLEYKITLSNINENDFSDIYNYYKDKMNN